MKIRLMENKVFARIANIFATIVLIFAILICVLVIASMKSSTGMAQLFGYSVLSVQSGSMEPVLYEGDLIVIKCTDKDMTFEEGDIITFTAYNDYGQKFLNTHRIIEKNVSNIRNSYITKGDNADSVDSRKVYQNFVLGKYTGHKVPGLGTVLDFVSSGIGVLLCVVLPSAIIIAWQIFAFAKESSKRKREFLEAVAQQAQANSGRYVEEYLASQNLSLMPGAAHASPELAEYEKQQIINEYLRAQKEEEAKKQAIIEEYLRKQKEAEEEAKAEAEAAKIKAIISEFLAQQQAVGKKKEEETQQEQNGQSEEAVEDTDSVDADK